MYCFCYLSHHWVSMKSSHDVHCELLDMARKYEYCNIVFRFSLSAITRTANDRERGKGLGLAGSPGVWRHMRNAQNKFPMPSTRCERSPSCFLLILYTLLLDRLVRFVKRPQSDARMTSGSSCVRTDYKIIAGFSNAVRVMADRFLAVFAWLFPDLSPFYRSKLKCIVLFWTYWLNWHWKNLKRKPKIFVVVALYDTDLTLG